MVSGEANQSETVVQDSAKVTTTSLGSRRSRPSPWGSRAKPRAAALRNTLEIVIVTFGFACVALIIFLVLFLTNKPTTPEPQVEEIVPAVEEPVEEEPVLPEVIDFQNLVDEWAGSVGGNKSVLIYDLERGEEVGSYNPDESYNTASLYKLFVVYEGYRRVQAGEWDGSETAGSTGRTILECLDLAIRESNSACAETLWNIIGHDTLDQIIANEFGITNSDISHLISNPRDILSIMKLFYEHPDITDETLLAQMKDSFLNQPITTYNWRQGLPSGFTRANVYNKVGWDYNPSGNYWNIYHDTAIVEFPEKGRHFIVVVMTNRAPFQKIAELGTMLENYYYSSGI